MCGGGEGSFNSLPVVTLHMYAGTTTLTLICILGMTKFILRFVVSAGIYNIEEVLRFRLM